MKAHVGTQGNEKANQIRSRVGRCGGGDGDSNHGGGFEAGVEEEVGGGEKGKRHGNGEGGTLEPQGARQLRPLSHQPSSQLDSDISIFYHKK